MRVMADHGGRYPWPVDATRRRILQSLIRRGSVEFTDDGYVLTQQGAALIADVKRRKAY